MPGVFVMAENDKWHLQKNISLGTLVTVVVLVISQIYQFAIMSAEMNARLDTLDHKVEMLTDDRVHKATIDQMFNNRDMQIGALNSRLDRIDARILESQKLLQKIADRQN